MKVLWFIVFDSIIIVKDGVPARLVDQAATESYLQQQRRGFADAILTFEASEL